MKAYGVKRKDTCQFCQDIGCLDRKYRLMRGKSRTHRKNSLKQAKSSQRFEARMDIRYNILYDEVYP